MKRFKNILYLIEKDEQKTCGLERAVALAKANQARLTIASVSNEIIPSILRASPDAEADDSDAADRAALERRVRALVGSAMDGLDIEMQVLTGMPFRDVVRDARRRGHDLVMNCVGTDGEMGRLRGSQEIRLLRDCPCPVWLSRPTGALTYRRILAAVDTGQDYPQEEIEARSALNAYILELAASLALAEFAELHVVHVWNALGEDVMRIGLITEPPDETTIGAYVAAERARRADALESALARLENHIGEEAMGWLKPVRHLPKGSPRDELPALVKGIDADLLVLGTVARAGVVGLLVGNTAEAVLKQVECSILALKPPGFAG
jgi:universal stress protein E